MNNNSDTFVLLSFCKYSRLHSLKLLILNSKHFTKNKVYMILVVSYTPLRKNYIKSILQDFLTKKIQNDCPFKASSLSSRDDWKYKNMQHFRAFECCRQSYAMERQDNSTSGRMTVIVTHTPLRTFLRNWPFNKFSSKISKILNLMHFILSKLLNSPIIFVFSFSLKIPTEI